MGVLRDLSIILLAVVGFVLSLIPLAALSAMVYGAWQLQRHENLPSWLRLASAYLHLGRAYVEFAARVVVKPAFSIHSKLATVQAWITGAAKMGGKK